VGAHPLPSSSEDDDADFSNIPFPQDTAMQQVSYCAHSSTTSILGKINLPFPSKVLLKAN
jgi:hypothetical protein